MNKPKTEKMCRACMETNSTMVDLYSNTLPTLSDMFMECTSVQITPDDGLPQTLCTTCLKDLETCHNFRRKCSTSDELLKLTCHRDEYKPFDDIWTTNDVMVEGNGIDVESEVVNNRAQRIPVNTWQFHCEWCKRRFRYESSLVEHNRRYHTNGVTERDVKRGKKSGRKGEKSERRKLDVAVAVAVASNFKCEVCNKILSNARGYRYHMNLHTNTRNYECEICNKKFTGNKYLWAHKKRHDNDEYKFLCPECGKKFLSQTELSIHVRRHNNVKPHKCDACEMSFATEEKLNLHKLRHTGDEPFLCDFCTKRFLTKANLQVHLMIHTGERPHVCKICAKGHTTASILRRHMRSHTGDKPFTCETCSRGFAQRSTLKCHMRSHTGEKPYECHVCQERFSLHFNLKRHYRKHKFKHNGKLRKVGKLEDASKSARDEFDVKTLHGDVFHVDHLARKNDQNDHSVTVKSEPEIGTYACKDLNTVALW